MKKVCVIGLGTIGTPTAMWIHEKGFIVVGYDERRFQLCIDTFTDWKKVPACDIYVICVDTQLKEGIPDMSNVFEVCSKITGKALVCIESTLSIGTARECATRFNLETLVHVPHRYWVVDPEEHGVVQPRVIGGLNDESLKEALLFYKTLEIPLHVCSSLEVAEMTKLAENAHRYVQIAFVEQLWLLCLQAGLPFEEVKEAMETKWNVELLEPRDGIKGSCLPKDLSYLIRVGKAPLFEGARATDKRYVEQITKK